MKRNQVFVRAKFDDGRRGTCDVLDLDDQSFRVFVMDLLIHVGLVTVIKDEGVEGDHIELLAKPGVPRDP